MNTVSQNLQQWSRALTVWTSPSQLNSRITQEHVACDSPENQTIANVAASVHQLLQNWHCDLTTAQKFILHTNSGPFLLYDPDTMRTPRVFAAEYHYAMQGIIIEYADGCPLPQAPNLQKSLLIACGDNVEYAQVIESIVLTSAKARLLSQELLSLSVRANIPAKRSLDTDEDRKWLKNFLEQTMIFTGIPNSLLLPGMLE
jgi:hypothetical protein